MVNVPNAKDHSPLWTGFAEPNFQKVGYNGVHGHFYRPPAGNTRGTNGFNHVASPYVKPAAPKKVDRIIANNLPGKTLSASTYDLPARKNVLQINLPNSTTKTTHLAYNAYTTPPSSFNNLRASLHGIDTVSKKELHGRFLEIEKPTGSMSQVTKDSQAAIKQLKQVEVAAAKLAASITPKPKHMVMPITTVNKKEKLKFELTKKQH